MAAAARQWAEEGWSPGAIARAVNRWHDRQLRVVIAGAVRDLADGGRLRPPVSFCWVLLGSSGRREMTLHSDQDHALVVADAGEGAAAVREYFRTLAERVVARLEALGYPLCPGFVLPTNPRWNGTEDAWREAIEGYLAVPHWAHVRYLLLAVDMRPVFGDVRLARRLHAWVVARLRDAPYVLWMAAARNRERAVALDWRGRLRVDVSGPRAGAVDIKEGGYLPLVSAVRLWAVAEGVRATSTERRIAALERRGVWETSFAARVQEALATLQAYRLWDNHVNVARLSAMDREALRLALRTVKALQARTAKRFRKPK